MKRLARLRTKRADRMLQQRVAVGVVAVSLLYAARTEAQGTPAPGASRRGKAAAAASITAAPDPLLDPELAKEQLSGLWERTLDPNGGNDRANLELAKRHVIAKEPQNALLVLAKVAKPQAQAATLRGHAAALLGQWDLCAKSFAQAFALPDYVQATVATRQPTGLPVLDEVAYASCLFRVGEQGTAEQVLASISQQTSSDSEAQRMLAEATLRHAEVLITLGRLREATNLLTLRLTSAAYRDSHRLRCLLALAKDVAKPSGDVDRAVALLPVAEFVNPAVPALLPANDYYLRGLEAMARLATARRGSALPSNARLVDDAERATVFFRKFLALAPTSPWRGRAMQHLEVAARHFPSGIGATNFIERKAGTVAKQVANVLPRLQACTEAAPTVVFRVTGSHDNGGTSWSAMRHTGDELPPETFAQIERCLVGSLAGFTLPKPTSAGIVNSIAFVIVAAERKP